MKGEKKKMTIREFYEWACEHGCEDMEFGVSIGGEAEVSCEENNLETCMEVMKDEIEVGGYYEHNKRVKDFVWLNIPFNEVEED